MSDRDPNHLCEPLRVLYREWLMECNAAGLAVKVIETWRSPAAQDSARAAGKSNASAGNSPHNCTDAHNAPAARAFDFGVFEDDGTYVTDGTDARYRAAAEIGKSLGLAWGGDWKSRKDWDHLELKNWKTNPTPAIFPDLVLA